MAKAKATYALPIAAQFHRADVLVTLDEDVKALAKLARVRVADPKELLHGSQAQLFEE